MLKIDPAKIAASNHKVIYDNSYSYQLLPTAEKAPNIWQYTTLKPADGWMHPRFDVASWSTGKGGFGTEKITVENSGTVWNSADIWLRRSFDIGDISQLNRGDIALRIYHDDECEVYINGVKAAELKGWTTSYIMAAISPEAQKALVKSGRNMIAIHCKQRTGGQYIDAGLSVNSYNKPLAEATIKALQLK